MILLKHFFRLTSFETKHIAILNLIGAIIITLAIASIGVILATRIAFMGKILLSISGIVVALVCWRWIDK